MKTLKSVGITVAMALLLAVSACSANRGEEDESGVGPRESEQSSSLVADAAASKWDPSAWKPTETITQVSYTEEQKLAFRDEWVKQLAPEGVPEDQLPDTELVRFPDSLLEYGQSKASCMTERGFPSSSDIFGGVAFEGYPKSQQTAFDLASYECELMYTQNPVFVTEWSPEQLGLAYDYWDEYLIPCLEDHGILVDASSKPSRDGFVENFHAPDGAGRTWYPPTSVEVVEWDDPESVLSKECPPMPPSNVFYGSGS